MATATITIELCSEDRARLDGILEALKNHNCKGCVEAATAYAAAQLSPAYAAAQLSPAVVPGEPATEDHEEPKAEPTPEPEQPAAKEDVPAVTLSDIQQKVVALSAAGKKAQVRDIITAYASRVSAIPEDKVGEVWQKLTELEG